MNGSTWFLNFIFKGIANKLDGYKTTIGAVGLILIGVTGLIGTYFPDTHIPAMDTDTALGYIAGGFTALGVGHKIEKNTKITQAGQVRSDELQRQIQRDCADGEG